MLRSIFGHQKAIVALTCSKWPCWSFPKRMRVIHGA